MFQKINLRELSEMQGAERAFVSLYVSGADGLGWLAKREVRLREMLSEEPDELMHFDESMKLMHEVLDEHPLKSEGLCLFACWANDFVRGHPLPVEVPNLLRIGPSPYIRPLAELQDEYENFLVVAADNSSTRILQVTSAVAHDEDTIRGDVKNRVKKGGWSQARYARRRSNQLMHYAKEVADVLEELCRQGDFGRIVLLGTSETLQEIEESLSKEVAAKVAGRKGTDLHAGEQALLDEAFDLYFTEERNSESRLWDRIKAEFFHGGLAAAGPTDVLAAALVGRVDSMIVTRDAKIRGTRCRECEHLVHGTPQTCQSCGSPSVFQVDLVDELTRQLQLTSGDVEFVDPIPALTKVGDVAALLRY